MTTSTQDTLAAIAGLDPATAARLTGHRPDATAAAEASLGALLDVAADDEAAGLDRSTRLLAAARAARVDGAEEVLAYYRELLDEEGAVAAELVADGADGLAGRAASRRVRALLRHVDLLVLRPAAATPDDVDALRIAGWSTPEIVVLSQIVSFVSYQTRVVAGLRVLGGGAA